MGLYVDLRVNGSIILQSAKVLYYSDPASSASTVPCASRQQVIRSHLTRYA